MEKRKFSVLKQMDNKTMLNKISGFSFYKKPWFAAGCIILVFVIVLSIGVHSLWKNTFGQINIVRETDAEKEKQAYVVDEQYRDSPELILSDKEPKNPIPYDKDVTNILLLGIDSRHKEKIDERSDAMLILTINQTQKKVKLTSLQRDMLVEMPGMDIMDKLNHANVYGGPKYVMETVNNALRLGIDRYVVVNIRGLERVIDLLDGIEINVKEDAIPFVNKNIDYTNRVFRDTEQAGHITKAGLQKLNGRQAVGYARNRSTIGGDYDRMHYQQEVIQGIFTKFTAASGEKKLEIIKEGLSLVTTNLTNEEMLGLMQSVLPILDGKIENLTIPVEGYHTHYSGAAWLNLCDFNGMIPIIQDFIFGKTFPFDPVAIIPGAPNSPDAISVVGQIDQWVVPDATDSSGNLRVEEPSSSDIYQNTVPLETTAPGTSGSEQGEPVPSVIEPSDTVPTSSSDITIQTVPNESADPSVIPPESSETSVNSEVTTPTVPTNTSETAATTPAATTEAPQSQADPPITTPSTSDVP
ncbi:MAG TPA: LCP family protein [Clostridiaceae bacterium]|nr:LCP family protein [Clostridiaceae bacterium]